MRHVRTADGLDIELVGMQALRSVALRASIVAGAILAGAALIGDWLFHTLGISLAAFRIAGGLLLFSIAFEMLFGVRIRAADGEVRDIEVNAFPIVGESGQHGAMAIFWERPD